MIDKVFPIIVKNSNICALINRLAASTTTTSNRKNPRTSESPQTTPPATPTSAQTRTGTETAQSPAPTPPKTAPPTPATSTPTVKTTTTTTTTQFINNIYFTTLKLSSLALALVFATVFITKLSVVTCQLSLVSCQCMALNLRLGRDGGAIGAGGGGSLARGRAAVGKNRHFARLPQRVPLAPDEGPEALVPPRVNDGVGQGVEEAEHGQRTGHEEGQVLAAAGRVVGAVGVGQAGPEIGAPGQQEAAARE